MCKDHPVQPPFIFHIFIGIGCYDWNIIGVMSVHYVVALGARHHRCDRCDMTHPCNVGDWGGGGGGGGGRRRGKKGL